MFLKELEITGFKSFANRTIIRFDRVTTAVVGPNGCGKSNILDAIKWVLGEKSVKSMRGEKMEDVIFSGTESRKPASLASVTLVLDNTDQGLPIPSPEVRIGRRLYRDGQSHYLLNDSRVTRRDIENLLMDTGLGKTSYSFMEQGQMDLILSTKPEDRRYLFEEAAGIARFKSQKEEAEKNLENTQLNLHRVQDILHELHREAELKETQAARTTRYNELRAIHREHDLRLRFHTIQDMTRRIQDFEDKLSRKKAEREKIRQRVLQLSEKAGINEQEKEENLRELHQAEIDNRVSRERIDQLESALVSYKERRTILESRIESLRQQAQKSERRIRELRKDLDGQSQLYLSVTSQIEESERALSANGSESELLRESASALGNRNQELEAQLQKDQENLEALRETQAGVIRDLLESLKAEKQNFAGKESAKQSARTAIDDILSKVRGFLENSDAQSALNALDLPVISSALDTITSADSTLRHLLFEQGGIHSRKEELDDQILRLENGIRDKRQEAAGNRDRLSEIRETLSEKQREAEKIRGDIRSFLIQQEGLAGREADFRDQIGHEETSFNFISGQLQTAEKELLQLIAGNRSAEAEIAHLKSVMRKDLVRIESMQKALLRFEEKKTAFLQQTRKETEALEAIAEVLNDLEIKTGTLVGSKEAFIQDIYNDYNLTLDELAARLGSSKIQTDAERDKLQQLEREIAGLGQVNPLAPDELKHVRSLIDHNETHLDDIRKARADILHIISEIQSRSEEQFMNTFRRIQENFATVFQTLFGGGEAVISLTDSDQVLRAGIEIQVAPPGKRARSLRLLSGGEKALTAVALMFAMYMVRSSPFCVLDEIDAPLDDQNVTRFLDMLSGFSQNTQFVLITHHKKTMARANAIFGVTMEEPGVSRLLSVEIRNSG